MRKFSIIDDDDITRLLITEILQGMKARILQTYSGIEACYLYKQYSNELDLSSYRTLKNGNC